MKVNSYSIELPENLGQGTLNDVQFIALLSITKINSDSLVSALYDYFVTGLSKSQAYSKHYVDKTIFSRKVPVMVRAFEKFQTFVIASTV